MYTQPGRMYIAAYVRYRNGAVSQVRDHDIHSLPARVEDNRFFAHDHTAGLAGIWHILPYAWIHVTMCVL